MPDKAVVGGEQRKVGAEAPEPRDINSRDSYGHVPSASWDRRLTRDLAVYVIAALMLVSACSSGSSGSSDPRSSSSPTPDRKPTDTDGDPTKEPSTVEFAGASATPVLLPGRDFEEVRQIPTVVDGGRFRYVGMLSDRIALGKKTPPAAEGEPGEPGPPPSESLVSVDLETGTSTTVASNGTEATPSYIVSASIGKDFAVWVETHHATMGEMDWDLYTLDLASKDVKKIASYADIGIKNPPWPSPSAIWPQLINDHVFLVAVVGINQGNPENAVFSVPADGSGKMTKVFDDAIDIFADGDDLVFDRAGNVGRFDTQTNKEMPTDAHPVEKPCGIFFNEGVLVQCSQDGQIIISERSGQRTTLTGLPGRMSYLNATSRWVGFSTNGKSYLYDLRRKRLGRLKNSVTFPIDRFHGNTIKYMEQGPEVTTDPTTSPVIELLPK